MLIISGLNCMLVSTLLSYSGIYWYPDNNETLVLVDTFFYTQMVQYTLWSYYFRLKTIPKFNSYDKYIMTIPFIIGAFQIPEAIYYNLDARFDGYRPQMDLTASLCGIAIILSEFGMYFLLVKKLLVFLEARNTAWIIKITATLIVLIILDFTEIIFLFVDDELSNVFYSLSFNVRLNAVILFFGDLVDFVKSGQSWKSHQNTPLNSQELGSDLGQKSGLISNATKSPKRASNLFKGSTKSGIDYAPTES